MSGPLAGPAYAAAQVLPGEPFDQGMTEERPSE